MRLGAALLDDAAAADQFSFPSGHTITAFAVAISLGAFYPALLIGLLFVAMSVAASRILLGMHFLSDVIAGAGIGGMLAYAAVGLFRWLV
ncbi:MAG TPA: phosphatase PAP2 family protein [Bryobacteraceae bacterium]|nr:phosphatase PAP2 family protein [Bryobacteraceae bacterium]